MENAGLIGFLGVHLTHETKGGLPAPQSALARRLQSRERSLRAEWRLGKIELHGKGGWSKPMKIDCNSCTVREVTEA